MIEQVFRRNHTSCGIARARRRTCPCLPNASASQQKWASDAGPSSKVPFALRWLQAELPYFLGKPRESLERMYSLLEYCRLELGRCTSGSAVHTPGASPSVLRASWCAVFLWSRIFHIHSSCQCIYPGNAIAESAAPPALAELYNRRQQMVVATLVNHHIRLDALGCRHHYFFYSKRHFHQDHIDPAASAGACTSQMQAFVEQCGMSVRAREYVVALRWLGWLLDRRKGDAQLQSKVGYVQLVLGDLKAAAASFQSVADLVAAAGAAVSAAGRRLMRRNRGLLLFAEQDFKGAPAPPLHLLIFALRVANLLLPQHTGVLMHATWHDHQDQYITCCTPTTSLL